jgi:phage I-like protein
MQGDLISAGFAYSVLSKEEKSPKRVIQYLPPGKHEITAKVNGETATREVIVEAGVEKVFQEGLEAHKTDNVTPFIDYLHENGRASGHPKQFSWDDKRGLVLEVDWTPQGEQAIASRELQYFSPEFLLSQDGIPLGLHPSNKAIGGLVSDPAFTSIESIAAKRAVKNQTTELNDKPSMDLSKFVEQGVITAEQAKSPDEALALIASHVEASRSKDKDKAAEAAVVKAQAEAAEAKKALEEMKETAAEAFIADGIKAGRIKKNDAETIQDLKDMHLVDSVKAQRFLDRMAPVNEGLTAPISKVAASRQVTPMDETKDLHERCQDLVRAGKAKNYTDAFRQIGSGADYDHFCAAKGIGLEGARLRAEATSAMVEAHRASTTH